MTHSFIDNDVFLTFLRVVAVAGDLSSISLGNVPQLRQLPLNETRESFIEAGYMRGRILISIFGPLPLNFMTIPDFDECFEEGHVSLLSILYLVLNSL